MAQQILLRRGTAAEWTAANPILAEGEMGLEKDTNKFVGICGLMFFDPEKENFEDGEVEIGYAMMPEFWGKGYTTEAGKAVLQFCFHQLQLNRIEATVETENPASIAAIQKLGLQHEGTFKEYEMNNDKFIDLMMFAILKSSTNY